MENPEQAQPFLDLVHQLAIERSQDLITGIRAYQAHPVCRDKTMDEKPVVWQQGSTRLLDYGDNQSGIPLLVIPSLINRFTIMDLDTDHSFLRYLATMGLHPYVIDWDLPKEEESKLSIGGYVTERLEPILDFLSALSTDPAHKVHVMGYCMGGLLALALTLLRQETVRSLSLLATPWHTGKTTIDEATGQEKILVASGEDFLDLIARLETPLKNLNYLPVSILQILFAGLQPSYAIRKFAKFAKMDQASAKARRFVLTEDWLNDGIPLSAPVTRELLGSIYGENLTGKIQWTIRDKIMDPRLNTVPTTVIVAGKDKIVPRESALPLARLIKGCFLMQPMLGHVGLMAGAQAPEEVWAPLTNWLLAH